MLHKREQMMEHTHRDETLHLSNPNPSRCPPHLLRYLARKETKLGPLSKLALNQLQLKPAPESSAGPFEEGKGKK